VFIFPFFLYRNELAFFKIQVQLSRKNFIAQMFLLLTFLVLIGSSAAVFNFFKCDEYDEFTLLTLDYSIDCDSPYVCGGCCFCCCCCCCCSARDSTHE